MKTIDKGTYYRNEPETKGNWLYDSTEQTFSYVVCCPKTCDLKHLLEVTDEWKNQWELEHNPQTMEEYEH